MANQSPFDIAISMAKDVIRKLDQQIILRKAFPGMVEEENLERLYEATENLVKALFKAAFENPNETSTEILFLINEIGNKITELKNA